MSTLFVLLLVVFVLSYVFLHQQKVNKYNLLLREQELQKQQELFLALNEGEEKERKRLAEELHDGIGAKLSGLRMSVEYLRQQSDLPQDKLQVLEKLHAGMNETIEELREVSQNLQPSFISAKGLQHAIQELVQQMNDKGACRFAVYIQLPGEPLEGKFQLVLFRLVSELLNNVQKHAQAATASVQLISFNGTVQIVVEDDGNGFGRQQGNGIGLMNIRNRVQLCNGTLNVDTGPNGTTVIIELPLTNKS